MKHIINIQSLNIWIDPAIYVYGVLIEQIWKLIGCFEAREAKLANTYDKVLKFYENLNKIATKSFNINICLYKNAILLENIVKNRLFHQYSLTLLAYSLTENGRNYFRRKIDDAEDLVHQNETGIVEDFFLLLEEQDLHQRNKFYNMPCNFIGWK